MDKRYLHQWHLAGGPACDDRTRHWTEITLTADELLGMLGCASGSTLVSLHIARDGFSLTITADERPEAPPCPIEHPGAPGSAVSRPGPASGLPGSSGPSS